MSELNEDDNIDALLAEVNREGEAHLAATRKRLEEKEAEEKRSESRKAGRNKYPWNEWLDGSFREIERGVDFDMPKVTMQSMLHNKANAKDLFVVTVSLGRNILGFQFCKTEEDVQEFRRKWRTGENVSAE